jgi:hypothetical protein
LAEIKQASNIVIKPADKGSAVVIQNREDYIAEGLRQLSDRDFYRETRDDLTSVKFLTNAPGTYSIPNPGLHNCIYFPRYIKTNNQFLADL